MLNNGVGVKLSLALLITATIMLSGAGGAVAKPGDLDPSYGDSGISRVGLDVRSLGNGATLDAQGRLVIAGEGLEVVTARTLQVARLTAAGRPDATFGGGDGYVKKDPTPDSDFVDSVATAANGDLLIGGSFGYSGAGSGAAGLVRLRPDGLAAPGFGTDGIVVKDFGHSQRSGGALPLPGGNLLWYGRGSSSLDLARFTASGVPDPSFGTGGLRSHSLQSGSGNEQYHAAVLQPDGKIVIGGEGFSPRSWILARINPDGSLDPSFGGDGIVETSNWPGPADPGLYGLAIQPDGRIIAAGVSGYKEGIAVARYLPSGELDPSFVGEPGFSDPVMDDGMLNIDFGLTDIKEDVASVAIQDNGRILLAGSIKGPGVDQDILVIRLKPNGEYDPTFGDPLAPGRKLIDIDGADDEAAEILLQDDGKILIAGTAEGGPTNGDFVAARLEGDPVAPPPAPPAPPANPGTSPQPLKDGWVHVAPRGKRLVLNRRGIARLRLRCAAAEASPPCAGRVVVRTPRLRIGKKKRRVVLARGKFRMGAGKTKAVRLKVGKRKLNLVRSRRATRRVQVVIRVRDRAGNHKTVRRTMRLRSAPVRSRGGGKGRVGRR